jgi:hypothetical protein
MKQCAKCGQGYDDALPFCLRCEGYQALTHLISGNMIVVVYRKPIPVVTDAPSLWRKE